MTQELAQNVTRVRDYIDEHGWCQNRYQNKKGQVCLSGAVSRAIGGLDGDLLSHQDGVIALRTWAFLQDQVQEITGDPHAMLYQYNDRVMTSKQEVLDFLDKAIIAAEEKA